MQISASASRQTPEKTCSSKATYDLIKRELFRRAAQLRGSDQAAYDKLVARSPSMRMENPVMESEDGATGAINCSGSLSLDLPPGVAAVGGRRTLMSDIDYTLQPAADGSGTCHCCAMPMRSSRRWRRWRASTRRHSRRAGADGRPTSRLRRPERSRPLGRPTARRTPRPRTLPPAGRPSFDCGKARTQGESRGLRRQRACGARRQHGRPISPRDQLGARPQQQALLQTHARPLPRLSRPLPEPPVHRRRLCRADARDPRHHGRPWQPPAISGG